jgi:DNA-binding NarL/FixJ family response regulator
MSSRTIPDRAKNSSCARGGCADGTSRDERHYIAVMRVLCIARHPILSEHLCRFFERFDVAAAPCVGVRSARGMISAYDPDVAICDYDLLTASELDQWHAGAATSAVPIVAVSMTKRLNEVRLGQASGVVGFLYLPTVSPIVAQQLLTSLRRQRDGVVTPNELSWPRTARVAGTR